MDKTTCNDRAVTLVLTTVGTTEDAASIAAILVQEKIVACCQAMPVRSTYRWKENLCQEAEVLLFAKTAAPEKTVARIKEIHPYELPEIIVLPVVAGYEPYLQWVREATAL